MRKELWMNDSVSFIAQSEDLRGKGNLYLGLQFGFEVRRCLITDDMV